MTSWGKAGATWGDGEWGRRGGVITLGGVLGSVTGAAVMGAGCLGLGRGAWRSVLGAQRSWFSSHRSPGCPRRSRRDGLGQREWTALPRLPVPRSGSLAASRFPRPPRPGERCAMGGGTGGGTAGGYQEGLLGLLGPSRSGEGLRVGLQPWVPGGALLGRFGGQWVTRGDARRATHVARRALAAARRVSKAGDRS